jgi:glycine cleavage system H protein
VVEANSQLEDSPSLINKDPEGEGWICKLETQDPGALDALMDEKAYLAFTEDGGSQD